MTEEQSLPIKSHCETCGGTGYVRGTTVMGAPMAVSCRTCKMRDPKNPFGPWIEKGQP